MSKTTRLVTTAALAAAISFSGSAWSAGGGKRGVDTTSYTLDEAEQATLLFMREEEKLARDVYLTLYGIHGAEVFANIMESEQRHFDSVGTLIVKYGLTDPASPDVYGVFHDARLQALYDELVARGATDLLSALYVGGLIEETDMDDLANAIEESDQQDLDRTYDNLREGSKDHLRAFVSNIEALGETYTPQYLSAEEVAEILAGTD